MPDNVWVLIVEHDLYARDMMSMLLTRDWRTRVTAEAGKQLEMAQAIEDPVNRIDLILLDAEIPGDPLWPHDLVTSRKGRRAAEPAVLCMGTRPNLATIRQVIQRGYDGYIVEREIQYGLAEAVVQAAEGKKWVATPDVRELMHRNGLRLPANNVILDGSRPVAKLTPVEHKVARLALLYSQTQREVADELQYKNKGQVGEIVSRIYDKLGLDEILSGEDDPARYFGQRPVLNLFRKAQERWRENPRSVRNKPTLAFHLLTIPEVWRFGGATQ